MFSQESTRWIVRFDDTKDRRPLRVRYGFSAGRARSPESVQTAEKPQTPPPDDALGRQQNGATHRDRIPLTEEQQLLATRYLPMARHIALRLEPTWPSERDELQSTAYMALVEAARTFDPTRRVGFGTYARHRIRGALRDLERILISGGWRRDARHPRLVQKPNVFDERKSVVLGINPERPVGAWIEAVEAVEDWLRRLPKAHAAACRLVYIEGKSQDEAAAEVGCSKSFFSRLHREAITWLITDYQQARGGQQRRSDVLSE
jgi:RNA polymerase sigma factor (sigma-70 family)